jgi:hypothetical protein
LESNLVSALAGDERFDRILALSNGAAFAGALVHFVQWPWELRHGIPTLTEAEGMTPEKLPAYNAILQLWAAAGALALATETPPRARRWAVAGLLTGEPLRRSAVRHVKWARERAFEEPEKWSPVLREV